MPIKILQSYKGTNIIKARTPSGQIRYGYRWTLDGKKYQKCRWKTKGEAEIELARFRVRMRDPNAVKDENVTLDELVEAWTHRATVRQMTRKRMRQARIITDRFKEVNRITHLRQISPSHYIAYQAARLAAGLHNHTINGELVLLQGILYSAARFFPGLNWLPPQYDKLRQLHQGRDVVLSREELAALIRAFDEPTGDDWTRERRDLARDVVLVGIETTMRISEIAKLEKSNIRFERGIGYKYGYIRTLNAKTRKPKKIPMTQMVAAVLKRRCQVAEGEAVFLCDGLTVGSFCGMVRRAFKRACKRAGITYGLKNDGAVFHTLRHSTTTHLVNQRIPLTTVMRITGHSRQIMVLRYSHPTPETIEEATEALALIGTGESTPADVLPFPKAKNE